MLSDRPPGAKPLTMRIGFPGQACANTSAAHRQPGDHVRHASDPSVLLSLLFAPCSLASEQSELAAREQLPEVSIEADEVFAHVRHGSR